MFFKACDICQGTRIKSLKNRLYHVSIPVDYSPVECLSADIKFMMMGFDDYKYLLVTTYEITNFILQYLSNQGQQHHSTSMYSKAYLHFGPQNF